MLYVVFLVAFLPILYFPNFTLETRAKEKSSHYVKQKQEKLENKNWNKLVVLLENLVYQGSESVTFAKKSIGIVGLESNIIYKKANITYLLPCHLELPLKEAAPVKGFPSFHKFRITFSTKGGAIR